MMRTLILAAMLALGCATAKADPAKQDEAMTLAVELLALMDVDKMFAGMEQHVEQMMQGQISSVSDCEALAPAIETFSREMGSEVMGMIKGDAFLADVATIYVDVFSVEELRGLIDFYRSPLGVKLLEKMPVLMQRSMEISERQMADMFPKMEAASQRFAEAVSETAEVCAAESD